uniref:Uncharacterized protein n=1 Tax=Parastrongyloides trichosuri TaxID=131310 RepID=A0A0N4ZU80_PARTI
MLQNQDICNNPWHHGSFHPVIGLCTIQCIYNQEMCMENEELEQVCIKIPYSCIELYQQRQLLLMKQKKFENTMRQVVQNQKNLKLQEKTNFSDRQRKYGNERRNKDFRPNLNNHKNKYQNRNLPIFTRNRIRNI